MSKTLALPSLCDPGRVQEAHRNVERRLEEAKGSRSRAEHFNLQELKVSTVALAWLYLCASLRGIS